VGRTELFSLERAQRQLGGVSRDPPTYSAAARTLNLLHPLLHVIIEVLSILVAHA
jgi:hypothetical protein